MSKIPFALQLYSVRDHLEKNPEAALHRVKAAGYDYVELAGTAGLTAAAFNALLENAGLRPVSLHAGYDVLVGDFDKLLADLKTLDLHFAVVPWVGIDMCPDKEAWLTAARQMDAAGARLREHGIQLCYHNHAHEFERLDGKYILDLIYENSASANLAAELDTCWADVGGADTVALMRQYGTRIPLLHIKDYVRSETGEVVFKEVGHGCMAWDPIFDAAKACNVAWYVVEQDTCEGDSLDSARISAAFMAQRQL